MYYVCPAAIRLLRTRNGRAFVNLLFHPHAYVQSSVIGEGTRIWQFVVVLPVLKIGRECNICSHWLVENDVVVGDRVMVKSGVQLWDGIRLEDDVIVGPNVTFTNDRFPRCKKYPDTFSATLVCAGDSIGVGGYLASGNNDWNSRHGWCRGRCYALSSVRCYSCGQSSKNRWLCGAQS